jgi:ERCC4-related helicase
MQPQTQLELPRPTPLENHLQKFCNKATHIYEELGPWAADYFILESIATLEAMRKVETDLFAGDCTRNRAALLSILKQDHLLELLNNRSTEGPYQVSDKFQSLIGFLGGQDSNECSGLLFVRQRATVSVLSTLLSIHPDTKAKFQCATFVGLSNNSSRKYSMAEMLDLKAQRETLAEFRARRKNLIVTTDALEEGIDVTACNLVICFDPPPNVKSFIQGRGRARQEKSNFAIMFPKNERMSQIQSWNALEAALISAYQDDMRKIQELAKTEDEEEVVLGKLETVAG